MGRDPYQGHETKYRLTRDIDLLTSLPRAEVGMTVTTADDEVSRWLEVRAPLASRRLRTLTELREAGIPTFAFVGPLLPHFAARPELLDHLLGQLVGAGVTEVFMEHINLKRYIRERMDQVLTGEPAEVREAYVQARTKEHRASTKSSTTTTTTPSAGGRPTRREGVEMAPVSGDVVGLGIRDRLSPGTRAVGLEPARPAGRGARAGFRHQP
ncbi:hypothetical protein [Streptomyces canus]|uniref:hypothetical protein n=1 Tax=Streptomyces canus TaxID=58343 RepID=UPI002E2B81BE|nr:hypothetical protein [Streptomyces canus]